MNRKVLKIYLVCGAAVTAVLLVVLVMVLRNRGSVGPLTSAEVSQLAAALEVPVLADARALWVRVDYDNTIGHYLYVRADFSATVELDFPPPGWESSAIPGRAFYVPSGKLPNRLHDNQWWDLGPIRPSDLGAYRWKEGRLIRKGLAVLRREGDRQMLYIDRLFTGDPPDTNLPPEVWAFLRKGNVTLEPTWFPHQSEVAERYWTNE